ncbi:MAG TPA: hypothetical protein PLR71_01880 [Deltaproteobacteria bacterium]|nr:hypothetical protein [Deltaproteobacteria bacterium]
MRLHAGIVLPALFFLLGLADIVYGAMRKDATSLSMGTLMAGFALYILVKNASS